MTNNDGFFPPGRGEINDAIASITGQRPTQDLAQAVPVAIMLQGAIAGLLEKAKREPDGNHLPIRVTDVEIDVDKDGTYLDYITVVTKTGLRIRVTVAPE